MSHTATSAQRQVSEATRLAMIAIFGCGDPECFKCYPSTTSVHDVSEDWRPSDTEIMRHMYGDCNCPDK